MELLLSLLMRFPDLWQRAGLALASLSIGAVVLGMRLARRIGRAEHTANRVGAAIDLQLDKLLPGWLHPFVPENALGFAAWLFVGACGLILAAVAMRVKRLYR
jgi:hypothetical protein